MRVRLARREQALLALWLAAVWLILLGVFHLKPGFISGIAGALSDRYYAFSTREPSPSIVLVAADPKSVQQLGRWPWPRETLARGFAKLDEAAVVGVDMIFSEVTSASSDETLGEALGRTTAVGGFFLRDADLARPVSDLALQYLANSSLTDVKDIALVHREQVETSVDPVLAGHALIASLNTLPDKDQLFRHYPAAFWVGRAVQPSLGTQILRVYLNSEVKLRGGRGQRMQVGDRTLPLDGQGFTRLDFYPEHAFRRISFVDLLSDAFDPASVRGDVVIVGVTEAGIEDVRATPMGQYPGPLIHATFISNVLERHLVQEFGTGAMALVLAIALLLVGLLQRFHSLVVRLAGYVVLVFGCYGIGVALYLGALSWMESAYAIAAVACGALAMEMTLLLRSQRHGEQLRTAFASYLPPAVVNRIAENPDQLKLGGEKKEVTLLFSDIRGFTNLSEQLPPEDVADLLLRYFEPMTKAVFDAGGTLDKYIGDAVMAIFNAPLDLHDHAYQACRAAIGMQRALAEFNAERARNGEPPVGTGIGLNTGFAVVGNLGSSYRFSYTAVGDVVNLAARLESATKELGADIVIGESTYERVKARLPCKPRGEIHVKGKEKAQTVYELLWREVTD